MGSFIKKNFLILILIVLAIVYLVNPLSKKREAELSAEQDRKGQTSLASSNPEPDGSNAQKADSSSGAKAADKKKTLNNKRLTLDELQKKYGGSFQIARTTVGKPFRLTGKIPVSRDPASSDYDPNFDQLIGSVSGIMAIDRPDQLAARTQSTEPLGTTTNLQQSYDGVPVDGAQVRVHQDMNGNVFMITSSFMTGVSGINMTATVSKDEAIQKATSEAVKLDQQARPPDIGDTTLVIYRFQSGTTDLCWKVVVSQPWLGAAHGSATYYVDAHQVALFERVENAVQ